MQAVLCSALVRLCQCCMICESMMYKLQGAMTSTDPPADNSSEQAAAEHAGRLSRAEAADEGCSWGLSHAYDARAHDKDC